MAVRAHVHVGEATDSLIAALADEAPLIRITAAAALLKLVD
jgi:HEAT repeat protein